MCREWKNVLSSAVFWKKLAFEKERKSNRSYFTDVLLTLCFKDLQYPWIIAIDTSNPLYQHTKLDEYVNISSSSAFLRLL